MLYHVLGYFADRFDQYDQTSVNNMILINNLHFKSRKLTLIHTDENPHEKGFERQWSPLKDKNLFLMMICKFFFWSWHRDYLLSNNKR